jgi:hypothetical protein
MKAFKFSLVVLVASLFFANCKKSSGSDTPPPSTSAGIEGIWKGGVGSGTQNPTTFYSFHIKAGGILEELSVTGLTKGIGTWKLDNGIFTGTYTYLPPSTAKYSVIGAYDANKKQIVGNWGHNNNATDGGLWDMDKQ